MPTSIIIPANDVRVRVPTSGGAVPRWLAYAIVLIVVLLGFCAQHVLRPVPVFPYDDPYIDLHSAQVLHSGFDSNYPGVPALFGVTSAPFAGLIYLLLFVLSPLQALNVSCWIGVLFYALGILRLARVLELRPSEQWLLVFIGLAIAPIPVHWFNGLETSCALASIMWTLVFASGDRRYSLAAAFLAGLTAIFRPDLLPFAFLLVGLLAWWTSRLFPNFKDRLIVILSLLLAVVVPVALCGFWYFHLTGSPIPLTGVAKRYFFAEAHWPFARRFNEEFSQLTAFGIAIGPLVLILLHMGKAALGRVLLAVWILFVVALFFQFPGEFGVNEFRYPVVLIPTLLWGLGMKLKDTEPRERKQIKQLMYFSAGYAMLTLPICLYFYNGERTFFEKGPRQVTVWCQQHLAPGTPVLVHDAGYLAYSTDLRTIDFVGLKTPSSIGVNRKYTWVNGDEGRAQVVSTLASESGSRYLILNSHWWPILSLVKDLRALGWNVELLDVEGAFEIFRLTPSS